MKQQFECCKGIILAGGRGTRLYPLSAACNKQLLSIFDKPVIYYPLTTLMLGGIRDILVISTKRDINAIRSLLGDGEQWGITLSYAVQDEAKGIPEAFIIGEDFIGDSKVSLILGDNFFHGRGLSDLIYEASHNINGSTIFTYNVGDPSRYGVVVLGKNGAPIQIVEKPKNHISNLAITGLYFFDKYVIDYAKTIKPSARNELEITDLLNIYMKLNRLQTVALTRGYVWFDVGTPESMYNASSYVQVVQARQGISIACPEEVAWRMRFINDHQLEALLRLMPNGYYSSYIKDLLVEIKLEKQFSETTTLDLV